MMPKETFAHCPRLLPAILFLLLAGARAEQPGNDFNVVESSFRQGDSVRVKSLRRTSDSITLLADYTLASEDNATLNLAIAGNSPTKPIQDPRKRATIKKGQGTVMLHFPHAYPGLPCVTLNHASAGNVLGHIYFGNPTDIAAARMPGVGQASSGTTGNEPSSMVQVKLAKIILPQVECENVSLEELSEYLSIVSRDYDSTTADFRLKGLPIMVTSTRKDSLLLSLSLRNVPLGEAIRHAAKIGNLSVSYTDTGVVIGDPEGMAQAAPSPSTPSTPTSPQPQEDITVAEKGRQMIFPVVNVERVSFDEMIEFIRVKSRDLDPTRKGVEIVVRPGAPANALITLDLKNIPLSELLLHVAQLCRCDLDADARGYVLTPRYTHTDVVIGDPEGMAQAAPSPSAQSTPASPQPQEDITVAEKGRQIIFPVVNVERISFDEMIEFIRLKSRDLDPAKKGVEIVVRPGTPANALITLDLKNIPLSELLLYVAELCRCDLDADARGYVLTPRS